MRAIARLIIDSLETTVGGLYGVLIGLAVLFSVGSNIHAVFGEPIRFVLSPLSLAYGLYIAAILVIAAIATRSAIPLCKGWPNIGQAVLLIGVFLGLLYVGAWPLSFAPEPVG